MPEELKTKLFPAGKPEDQVTAFTPKGKCEIHGEAHDLDVFDVDCRAGRLHPHARELPVAVPIDRFEASPGSVPQGGRRGRLESAADQGHRRLTGTDF